MTETLALITSVILAYLLGSFPTSFVLVKKLKGIDVRHIGSGNAGATNVLRAAGKLPAIITLIVDMLKGILAVTVIAGLFCRFMNIVSYDFFKGLLGLAAVCGHIWPVFLRFRGGKGVATTLGVAAVLAPAVLVPSLIIWLVIFFLTGYVSLASIIALTSFPIIAALFCYPFSLILVSVFICTIVIYKHKDNIARLLRGEENSTRFVKRK